MVRLEIKTWEGSFTNVKNACSFISNYIQFQGIINSSTKLADFEIIIKNIIATLAVMFGYSSKTGVHLYTCGSKIWATVIKCKRFLATVPQYRYMCM